MQYLGDFAEDQTVYIPFNTFTSDDPQASATITNLADADIKVHKDGSTTEIVTDGATVAIDFDSVTGNHLITIDTSAHADYAVGSDYLVRIEGTTVDGGTINAWVGSFSIENRFKDVNVVTVSGTAQTANDNGADINTLLNRIVGTLAAGTHNPASAAQIAVLSDWINGGRLDLLLDAVKAVTDVLPDAGALTSIAQASALATAQLDLDTITGADGAALASTQQSITFQPIVITASDGIPNITLAGSGAADGLAFTRSGAGGLMDSSWSSEFQAEVNAAVDTALDTAIPGVPTAGSINDILNDLDALLPVGGTLSILTAANVNSEVVDVLFTDTQAELAAVPAANAPLADKIAWNFLLARNKLLQTSALQTVRNDADGADIATATVSDDGTTFTRGEFT